MRNWLKIIISPDSFKGTLSAITAAEAIQSGIKDVNEHIQTVLIPVADGGEGTLDSLIVATKGSYYEAEVLDPLGRKITAHFGVLGDNKTCVIEMAKASGITLLHNSERNPHIASSFGTGQLIKKGLDLGYRDFIICIGGSATNDGGVGMLRALGLELLDEKNNPVEQSIAGLLKVVKLNEKGFDSRIFESNFKIACDVNNPLIGEHGATAVFGPQKGVPAKEVQYFDACLTNWANIVEKEKNIRLHDYPGAGAAGGMGGALIAFLNGQFNQGIDLVLEAVHFNEQLSGASFVVTGEGKSDRQTLHGKAPYGIASTSQKAGVPTILISGAVEDIPELAKCFHTVASLVDKDVTVQMAMEKPAVHLRNKTKAIFQKLLK